jgi:L-iditol 2-dehydrogenase
MRAAVLKAPKHIVVENIALPEPSYGEVRVKISKVGICGSDVHIFLGHRLLDHPIAIGHEGIGTIDKIGEGVNGRTLGQRVAIEPNIPCRQCKYCLSGRGNICINKRIVGVNEPGCFAEYICLPESFCWAVPDAISDADALTIEPMAVAYHALFSAKTMPGDTIAILGLGAIGLLLSHLALAFGYKVLVSELDPSKTQIAVAQGAIAISCSGSFEQQASEMAKTWTENDVSAVFECAGSAFTASLATAAAPRGSEIVLVGLSEKDATFRPLKIAREGIAIVPSIIYDHPTDFKRVIQLISAGVIKPGHIVSGNSSLENISEALFKASEGKDAKIVVSI